MGAEVVELDKKYRVLVRFRCGHVTDGDTRPLPADARDEEARRVVRAPFVCPVCAGLGGR